ncbi:hypothetical protein O6H91_10G053200 [Diphasiastrum complanatum]|uniref:Uncharacterized protein n=1 Tax=Diphasiastrum complanatum TaxID=34168 RepID=A0ACC2CH97_DIPCM|nr:hypothetical protein O6H91_10G053200 [Diphasiastrum complanatum]
MKIPQILHFELMHHVSLTFIEFHNITASHYDIVNIYCDSIPISNMQASVKASVAHEEHALMTSMKSLKGKEGDRGGKATGWPKDDRCPNKDQARRPGRETGSEGQTSNGSCGLRQ